jgi:hypothetical protein
MVTLGSAARAAFPASASLVLYDPALPQSETIARRQRHWGSDLRAIRGDRVHFWTKLAAEHRGAVSGVTNWSDLVLLRGLAAERGMRLRAETHLGAGTGTTDLFAWMIA